MTPWSRKVVQLAGAVVALSAVLISTSCSPDSCGPFSDWRTSPYVLPYAVGASYFVNQANCSTGGHRGVYKHGYDFVMPIGTKVTAARAGRVEAVRMEFKDGQ